MAGLLADLGLFGPTASPGGFPGFQGALGGLAALARLGDIRRAQAVVGPAAASTAQRDATARAHGGELAVLDDSRQILATGRAILDKAEEAFPRIQGDLAQLRALAVKAQDPGLRAQDRTDLTTRVAAITADIDSIASNTKFGATPLLDGSLETTPIRLNPGVAGSQVDDLSIRLGGTRASDLGVASLDLSSKAAADAAVATGGTLDVADKTIAALKGRIAALRDRLAAAEGRFGDRQEFHRASQQALLAQATPAPFTPPRHEELRDLIANPQAHRTTQEEKTGQVLDRFLRDNADLARLVDANPSAREALAKTEVRMRDDLRAVLVRGVGQALGPDSPLTAKFLENHFDLARFLALDPGGITATVRGQADLGRALTGEAGLVQALGGVADQRVGELLSKPGPGINRFDAPQAFAASTGGALGRAETITVTINGVSSPVSLAAGDSISAAVKKINAAVGSAVIASDNAGRLRIEAINATTSFSVTSGLLPDGSTSGIPYPAPFTQAPAAAAPAQRKVILDRAVALLNDPVKFSRDFLDAHPDFAKAVVGSSLQGGPIDLAEFARRNTDLISADGSTDRLTEAFEVRVAAETFGRRIGLGQETFRANPGFARLVNRASADVLGSLAADGDRLRSFLRNEEPGSALRLRHPDLFREHVRPPVDEGATLSGAQPAPPPLRPAPRPLTQPSPAGFQINFLA